MIAARLDSNWTGGVAVASQKCAKARASLAPSIPVLLRITLIKVSAIWYCNRLRTTVRRFITQGGRATCRGLGVRGRVCYRVFKSLGGVVIRIRILNMYRDVSCVYPEGYMYP